MATYTCKWCGNQNSNPQAALGGECYKSPHRKHELLNATEKLSQYVCKWCGLQSGNPQAVVGGSCHKSPHPNKQHELLG